MASRADMCGLEDGVLPGVLDAGPEKLLRDCERVGPVPTFGQLGRILVRLDDLRQPRILGVVVDARQVELIAGLASRSRREEPVVDRAQSHHFLRRCDLVERQISVLEV